MDETGLTGVDKITLYSAWGLLRQNLHTHGRNILLLFFQQYPQYLTYFNFSDDPTSASLVDNKSLLSHSINIMKAFGSLIEHCLEDPMLFKELLRKIARQHRGRNVSSQDVYLLGFVMTKYFTEVLDRQITNELPRSLYKLFDTIAEGFPPEDPK